MRDVESSVRKLFHRSVTDRERAIFEGAITLGAIYHQFVGVPVYRDPGLIQALETLIERSMRAQPYKENVKVRIKLDEIRGSKAHPYDYEALKGRHMDVEVKAAYGRARATVRMRYIPELEYTLMYIEDVAERD